MANEEQLSPEEKLLKVIQATDGQKPKASEKAPEPVQVSPPPAERRVKLAPEPAKAQPTPAKQPEPASPPQAVAQPQSPVDAAGSQPPEPAPEPASPVPSGSLSDGSWLRHANRVLGGIAAAMILLIAYECWSSAETLRASRTPTVGRALPPFVSEKTGLPPLDGVVALFEKGPVFQNAEDSVPAASAAAGAGSGAAPTGWRLYAQKNLDLIGMASGSGAAQREAIVVDREQKRMHIVKSGDRIQLEGKQIEVLSVGEEEVTLSDGGAKLTIK
jgi:hypothetical protein